LPTSSENLRGGLSFGVESVSSHLRGEAFPSVGGKLFRNPEFQTLGQALGYTGGLETQVQPIFTIVTLNGLGFDGIPLAGPPGAGGDAALAPDAETGLDEHNPITASALDSPRGTYVQAPGLLAVKARHENKAHLRNVFDHHGSHRHVFT